MMMMAKKAKRISVNALEKCIERKPEIVNVEWNGLDIVVKKRLSFEEMIDFVNGVAQSCFAADTNDFIPGVKDFVIGCFAIEMYSNLTLPHNVSKKYEIISSCDVVDVILENVDRDQFDKIVGAINDKIRYLINVNLSQATVKINELLYSFGDIESKVGELFGKISPNDVQALVSAISEGKIDEGKLMEAYLESKNKGDS